MDIRALTLLLPLGFALAACTNHEPVDDAGGNADRTTVPTDAPAAWDGADVATGGVLPATDSDLHATEAGSVAIDATGQDARDAAAAEVDAAEPVTRDDSVNQYDRAPQAADALEGGYNDDDKDGDD